MDWVRNYGKGRVYTTMLGHTWKDEANPNLDDVYFQALLARGTNGPPPAKVTFPPDLGWKPLFNGKEPGRLGSARPGRLDRDAKTAC